MSTAMTSPDQLALYLGIRNSIDVLRELATGIDEDIGRRQIYGETEAVDRALERTRALTTTIELIKNQLCACSSSAIESPRSTFEVLRSSSREAA
jgi:hypothetical protein